MDRFHLVLLLVCLSAVETAGQRFVRREGRGDSASVVVGAAGDLSTHPPADGSLEEEEGAEDLGGELEAAGEDDPDTMLFAEEQAAGEDDPDAMLFGDEQAEEEDGSDAALVGDEQAEEEDGSDAALVGDEQACAAQTVNPKETSRRYSAVHSDNAPGTLRARSMLDSPEAWCAKQNRIGEWMDIDLGKVQTVQGTIVQGRHTSDQWVTKYKVKYSVDGKQWKDEPHVCQGSGNQNTKAKCTFPRTFHARYVRLLPQTWHRSIAMRAGVVVCEGAKTTPTTPVLRHHYCSRNLVRHQGRSVYHQFGSVEDCERKCDHMKRCRSFTYWARGKVKRCWLKDRKATASDPAHPHADKGYRKGIKTYYRCPKPVAVPQPAPTAAPTPATPTHAPGPRRYCPRNLVQEQGKSCGHESGGAEECEKKCDQIKSCHSFTLNLKSGDCSLKEKNVHADEAASTSSNALQYSTYYLCAHPPKTPKSPDPWAGPPTPGSSPPPTPHPPTPPCSR